MRGLYSMLVTGGQALAVDVKEMAAYKVLDSSLWKTKHCRHLASSRLKKRSKYSQYTITCLSIYVLLLSIGPKFNYFTNFTSDQINFSNVFLSIAIISLSLLEANNNYDVQAERLYHCANEVGSLLIKLNHVRDFTSDAEKDLDKISSEYDKILHKYNENHSGMDYELFMASQPGITIVQPIIYKLVCLKYLISSFGMYFLLTVAPVLYCLAVYYGIFK